MIKEEADLQGAGLRLSPLPDLSRQVRPRGLRTECARAQAQRQYCRRKRIAARRSDGARRSGALPQQKPRVSLTTRGDVGVASILEFARYPKAGDFAYKRTLRLRPRTVSFVRRNLASIVVHGIDYNGNGIYDGTLGRSDLNPALSAESTASALCGELVSPRQSTAHTPHPPHGTDVYSATLRVPPGR